MPSPRKKLCIQYKKAVDDYEIRITVSHTGTRRFAVLKTGAGVASGTIHWGARTPVRYDPGAEVPLDFSDHILRASYDMYR